MLVIRFNRVGRHNHATYRIVVQDRAVAPGGRHVAIVGSHDPHSKKTTLNGDAIKHWLSVGAQPSVTVHNILVKNGIIRGKKIPKGVSFVPQVPQTEGEKAEQKTEGESVAA